MPPTPRCISFVAEHNHCAAGAPSSPRPSPRPQTAGTPAFRCGYFRAFLIATILLVFSFFVLCSLLILAMLLVLPLQLHVTPTFMVVALVHLDTAWPPPLLIIKLVLPIVDSGGQAPTLLYIGCLFLFSLSSYCSYFNMSFAPGTAHSRWQYVTFAQGLHFCRSQYRLS